MHPPPSRAGPPRSNVAKISGRSGQPLTRSRQHSPIECRWTRRKATSRYRRRSRPSQGTVRGGVPECLAVRPCSAAAQQTLDTAHGTDRSASTPSLHCHNITTRTDTRQTCARRETRAGVSERNSRWRRREGPLTCAYAPVKTLVQSASERSTSPARAKTPSEIYLINAISWSIHNMSVLMHSLFLTLIGCIRRLHLITNEKK